jgi:phage terminase large subunit GpA-like protein
VTAAAAPAINQALARAIAPRKPLSVSAWADDNRVLSSKGSAEPGKWRTSRNPPLREPMDCMSKRSTVREVLCKFPVQFGKTEIAVNCVGYWMDHDPGPVMVCLPGEVSMNKWIEQKLNPMIEESEAVQRALTSLASRDAANRRTFKDFAGGQLYLEHAGNDTRLKSTTVQKLVVDELSAFAATIGSVKDGVADDPMAMLRERISAFPSSYKLLYITTPGVKGVCRSDALWEESDQRRWNVACPHCRHEQPLEWKGLHWNEEATECWYACRECGACIEEHHKTAMIAAGRWVPGNPGAKLRGYTINCLYYQFGIGPRWLDLVHEWIAAQNDPAKLKTFINDRLAESWEDPAMRAVKHNALRDRAEVYPLRTAIRGVLAITAGVDTQDNRLAAHIIGWGRGMAAWTLDYVELPGDPANDEVWVALTELMNRPIECWNGALARVEACLIDGGGHRTEDVKAYVRRNLIRRPMVGFGAKANNAPVLGKGKLADVNWRGQLDKGGVTIYQVGTVAAKHYLYARLASDAEKQVDARLVHLSRDLDEAFFAGLVSERYNPGRNRFEKSGGVRNEPLDTWGYGLAAAHHPELRLHRLTRADWDVREAAILAAGRPEASRGTSEPAAPPPGPAAAPALQVSRGTSPPPRRGIVDGEWTFR